MDSNQLKIGCVDLLLYLDDLERFCDQIALIRHGRLLQVGSVEQVVKLVTVVTIDQLVDFTTKLQAAGAVRMATFEMTLKR